jgi:RimJ/RimL family protein N-acetyltransferase
MDWRSHRDAMIRMRIRTLASMRARFGWRRTIQVALLWFLRQSINYREAIIFCLDLPTITPPPICSEFAWGYSAMSEIDPAILADAGLDRSALDAYERNDERCFVGRSNGTVCYLSIVSTSGFSVPERLSVQFQSGSADAYVGNCFTVNTYRGRGVYPCALRELGLALRSEGRQRLYLFVERDNLASIRSVEKAGFRRVAICRVLKWRGRSKQSWAMLDKRAGVADTLQKSWAITPLLPC